LKSALSQAPNEKKVLIGESSCIISLPLPNGNIQRFRIVESPIMAEELAAAFPDIKTYSVKGIDDPYASGKIDWNEFGFHGMILTMNGDFFIDPYCLNNTVDYISYYRNDFEKAPEHRMIEESTGGLDLKENQKKDGVPFRENKTGSRTSSVPALCVGDQLRTYRLAVACTGEYAKAATGSTGTVIPTVAQTLAKIVTSINRVDGVYEREVAVRMVLVATETLVIFTNPATDPFTGNNNGNTLLNESQTVITATIGSANFDIGHSFSTGAGGVANLGCVCLTNNKARGVTGGSSPVGDPYDIDYVAHEMGHQFGGDHTFNAVTGSCSGNRNGSTAVEPGSGVTIMAYAGICPGNDVANHSIANFHAISYDQIVSFTHGAANSCAVTSTTGNHPPIVTIANSYIIPVYTPFVMTGSATDPDGDKLYYSWEETDAGTMAANWTVDIAPYFRSYPPDSLAPGVTDYSRYFPKKSVAASSNFTSTIGERLPQTQQTLNFRLTVRDNKMGGGGVCYANTSLVVDASGPLSLTYPSASGISWPTNSFQTVTWDVNGTDQAPVSCDTVRLWISFDSGNNYSLFNNSTPNDGIEVISVPSVTSTINTCRMKVEGKGNIFYDVSNFNFAITATTNINTVGLQQVSQSNPVALNVWPNPSSGQLNFTAGNLNSGKMISVSVLDMLGRTLLQFNYNNRTELKESLDVSSLNDGVYFIKVSNDNKQAVHRLVKN
jgi:hypothetical protein